MITFTPLSGPARASGSQPLAYLLNVDDVRILLDCGSPDWTPEKNGSSSATTSEDLEEAAVQWEIYCNALKNCCPTIDLVLISHGDLAHSGLYAYAYSRWGLNAPAYTTIPVQAMARITTTADIEAIREEQDLGERPPNLSSEEVIEGDSAVNCLKEKKGKYVATTQEVHTAFEAINTLRYSQPTHLQGKCQGLTITPFNAGHTLGGTIWKIRSPSSGTILYAVGLNHMREHHLDGTVLYQASGGVFEPLVRPDLLITDANRADVITPRRKDRDAALIDAITATLDSRNSLFLPCDAGPRLLELLVLLDRHWSFARLRAPICLLSKTAGEMLQVVRSLMEWLGGSISKEDVGDEGAHQRSNQNGKRRHMDEEEALGALALRFRHLEIFPNHEAMLQRYSSKDPKLILAVPASLSHGPSRLLFTEFAGVTDNVILLTSRGEDGTLARAIFEQWNDSQRPDAKWDKGKIGSNIRMDSVMGVMELQMHAKVPLRGDELESYLEQERMLKEQEAASQVALARNQRVLEADEDDSDSDGTSDDEDAVADSLIPDENVTDVAILSPIAPRGRKLEKVADATDNWVNDGDEGLTKQLLSFDIYLKGNVSRATSFFKSTGSQTPRFRMFPWVEKKRRVDEFGETVDVGMWLRKGRVLEENAETDDIKTTRPENEDKTETAAIEPPSKYITTLVRVNSACRLLFIDMEGLNDGRAIKTIVPQINPRKMILVHSSSRATDILIESCGSIRAMTKEIFAPVTGESIQIGQHTNAFSISLSDELMNSTRMSSFEDNEVGFVKGRVYNDDSSIVPILFPAGPESAPDAIVDDSQATRALGSRPKRRLPKSTMVGELKLTSLKARLANAGVHAELIGEGTLICGPGARKDNLDTLGESVSVRKTGRGNVELEGNVSDIYYTVRKEIYNLHATLVAA